MFILQGKTLLERRPVYLSGIVLPRQQATLLLADFSP